MLGKGFEVLWGGVFVGWGVRWWGGGWDGRGRGVQVREREGWEGVGDEGFGAGCGQRAGWME